VVNAHIAVTYAIRHSFERVIWYVINAYIVVSAHNPVMCAI